MSKRKPVLPVITAAALRAEAGTLKAQGIRREFFAELRAAEVVIRAADRLDRAARGLSGAKWAVVTAQHRRAVDRWRRVTRRTP